MSSTHTIDAVIPVGDPDLGAAIEARIETLTPEQAADLPVSPATILGVLAASMVAVFAVAALSAMAVRL